MALYAPPGNADALADDLVVGWNRTIQAAYDDLGADLKSRFFSLDPGALVDPVDVSGAVKWFAPSAEPEFCLSTDWAEKLSDWGHRGRHGVQNEYCEYRVLFRLDGQGRSRPKRVEITTELREYWLFLAVADPELLRSTASAVLGQDVGWEELYQSPDPTVLSEAERKVAFARTVAGHGNDVQLERAGVPANPEGRLNRERALFMSHPINGLDDLLYIVMFGARPYALRADDVPSGADRKATLDDIFVAEQASQLRCRHADPAAAQGAYDQAYEGRTVAFSDPLGMYIVGFRSAAFEYDGRAIPEAWIRRSRGSEGKYQRLEFGPPDDSSAFLDDITVTAGATQEPLRGGYQVVTHLEIGPGILVGDGDPVGEDEYRAIPKADPILCREAPVCSTTIEPLRRQYELAGGARELVGVRELAVPLTGPRGT